MRAACGWFRVVTSAGAQAAVPGSGYEDNMTRDIAFSRDGSTVVFVSSAANFPALQWDSGQWPIYAFNQHLHTLTQVTRGLMGAQLDGSSAAPDVSFNGSVVVTETWATDVLPGDTKPALQDRHRKILAIEPASGGVERVSAPASAIGGSGDAADSVLPSVSDNGQVVVFGSWASLVADDTDQVPDV
jgi:Tol biopolymer transport system component